GGGGGGGVRRPAADLPRPRARPAAAAHRHLHRRARRRDREPVRDGAARRPRRREGPRRRRDLRRHQQQGQPERAAPPRARGAPALEGRPPRVLLAPDPLRRRGRGRKGRRRHSRRALISSISMQVRRILCAVDFSEPSHEALHYGADLAKLFGAELTLFHVYHVPGYGLPEGSLVLASPDELSKLFAKIDERLAEWRKEAEAR